MKLTLLQHRCLIKHRLTSADFPHFFRIGQDYLINPGSAKKFSARSSDSGYGMSYGIEIEHRAPSATKPVTRFYEMSNDLDQREATLRALEVYCQQQQGA